MNERVVLDAGSDGLGVLRDSLQHDVTTRWTKTAREVKRAILLHDALGIGDKAPRLAQPTADKAEMFKRWLDEKLLTGVAAYDGRWLRPPIEAAAAHGTARVGMGDAGFDPGQPRDDHGRWGGGGGGVAEAAGYGNRAEARTDFHPKPDKPIGSEARDYVLAHGRETSSEYMVALDKTGKAVAVLAGDKASVGFSPKLDKAIDDPSEAIVIHHNHPNGSSLSGMDISQLARPGLAAIWAHGNQGISYRAALTPEARQRVLDPQGVSGQGLFAAHNAASETIAAAVMPVLTGAALNAPARNALVGIVDLHHAGWVNRALHQAGIIDYQSGGADTENAVAHAMDIDGAIDNGAAQAREIFYGRHVSDGLDRPDRPSQPLRLAGDVGAPFGEAAEPARGHAAEGRADRPGDARDHAGEAAGLLDAAPSAEVCHAAAAGALADICEDVSNRAHMSVASGLMIGARPSQIAQMVDQAFGHGLQRTRLLAEHAVTMAHAQATLDALEAKGVTHVGTISEHRRRLRDAYDPDQPRDELGKWTVSYSGRQGSYDPKFFRAEDDPLEDEHGVVVGTKQKLVATREANERLPLQADPNLMYRGMSHAEYEAFRTSGEIKTKGDYNFGVQAGLTYFTTEPDAAETYANAFAPRDYKPDFGKPAYVVAAKQVGPDRLKRIKGTSEHELGVMGPIAKADVVEVWRGTVIARDPGEKDRLAPSARLHWQKVTDALDALDAWFGDAARKTPQPKHPRHGRFEKAHVVARELRRSKRTGRFRKQGLAPDEQRREELREARFGRIKGKLDVLTQGDDRVCDDCDAISDNGPYTINAARGLIPAHPNCRCLFVAAGTMRDAWALADDWAVVGNDVIPLGGVRKHTHGFSCWCHPDDDEGIVVHHQLADAFDPDQPRDEEGRWTLSAMRLSEGLKGEAGYAYHVTNEERLGEIAEAGELSTHGPSAYTDQEVWPDGSEEERAYFAAHPLTHFAPEEGVPVVIRMSRGVLKTERGTGDLYSTKPISAEKLEYLHQSGQWRSLSKPALADFDPDEPRDESGRWTAGGGGQSQGVEAGSAPPAGDPMAKANWVLTKARMAVKDFGYDPDRVFLSRHPPKFKVGDHEYTTGGVAYTTGGGLDGEGKPHQKGDIVIYGQPDFAKDLPVRGIATHEAMHQKWQSVYDKWAKGDEAAKPLRQMHLGEFISGETSIRLEKEDGVSSYSKSYWDSYAQGKGSYESAVHETLAEIARIDEDSSSVSKRHRGTNLAPLNSELDGKPIHPDWLAFYDTVNEAWRTHVKPKKFNA